MATSTQITQVTQLFTALFMRAPAVSGLNYYTGRLETGATLAEVAQEMYDTAPARTYYADGATPNEIVTSFFTNTLGRAPLQGGLDYWSLQLATQTQGEVIAAMITAVVDWAPTGDATADAEGADSQNLFNNKVTVGEYFATTLLATDATLAAAAYDLVTKDPASVATANAANTTAVEATQSPTFTLTASASSHLEGDIGTATYTVTASKAVTADTAVTFAVSVGSATAADQGTSTTNMNDFAAGTFNPVTVTILAGATTAEFSVTGAGDSLTELPETYSVTATVAGQTLTATATLLDGAGTYNLLAAAEQISGTVNNDTFNGSNTTLLLDQLDGKGGTDTLNYADTGVDTDADGIPDTGVNLGALGAALTSIEVINVRSIFAATANTSAMTGVTSLNATAGTSAALTAATSTDVSASGITGAVVINGGKGVTVTDTATAAADITIGATTVGAGTVTVTDSKVGAGSIAVDGGTNVTITATGSSGGGDTITVGNGGATTDLPSGTVSVTSAHTGVAATDVVLNAITVKGGSTVTVTQSSDTSKAAADTTGATLTQGAVTVVGGDATTSVTVAQAKSTTEVVGVTAVAGATETASVKFTALTIGQTLILGGLTFTASAAMTAAEAAGAFANLIDGTLPVAGDTQSGGAASKGTYTGAFTGWTSGAVSTDTVVFTSTTSGVVADIANTGTGTATVTTTQGSAVTAAKTGVLGVITGVVTIDDNATASITTVSVDGYGNGSQIGNTASLTKLATLTLANSGGATAGATNGTMSVDATGVASLNLSINNIKGNVTLDGAADGALKTLNLTTTGADSSFALTAAAVETLAISGDKKATLSTGTFTALKTLTVSGSASAVFDGDEADTLTSVTTTGTTGAVTATIDGTKATYTGGAGVDTVTLATGTALTKAIDLGAGNDTLSFAALNVTGSTATLAGGLGDDTLSMAAATAANLDGSIQSFYTGFEYLTINDAGGSQTIDLANLGFTTQVTTNGGTITLDKLANNGKVILNAATTATTVQITDAADSVKGLADVLNVTTSSAATGAGSNTVAYGTVTAADIETINLTASDTLADNDSNGTADAVDTATMTLVATKATKINVTGNANLTLTNTGNIKVAAIDGSTMTGILTVQAAGGVACTITGGSGDDVLTASGGAGGGTAQVSTVTFTDGAGNAAMAVGDTISVTIGSTTVSQVFDTNLATTLDALAVKIQDIGGDSVTYTTGDSAVAGVITITAAVAGTPFTADATFTQGTASSITSVYADGAISQVLDVDTIAFTDNDTAGGLMAAGDEIVFTITPAAGAVTTITQVFDTDFATTVAAMTAQVIAAGYAATDDGSTITVTGKAGSGAIVLGGFVFTDANVGSAVTAVPAEGAVNFIADADTLTLTEATAITVGDTITATVTNGVGTYTTAAVPFNTNYATTMGDLATAIAGLNGGASFTAAHGGGGGGVITVTDAVVGGSPITAASTSVVVDQVRTVTDVFATTTANVTPIGDTLIGGDGNDTLNSGAALGTMTGGAGQDLFVVAAASTNVNAYTTITDFTAEDLIEFAGAVGFESAAVPLGSTAQFTDRANAAINALALNEVGWFQFGTDTYLVMDAGGGTAFANGTDYIVKLTGLIDLSNASFNNTHDTIAL